MYKPHVIRFYPVGNGDTSQIILGNGKRILLDYCNRSKSGDCETPEIDLRSELQTELRESNQDFLDVVAFTHADQDHICGSTETFFLEHAIKYQEQGRIKIKELWVPAAMLLEEAEREKQSEEFVILRQEARHRLLAGKNIRIFSKPKKLMDWLIPKLNERGEAANARDHLFVDAGQIVPGLSLADDNVEFFCHSPFIKHVDGGDVLRNQAALVFNVRFRAGISDYNFLAVGDADWEVLTDIVNISKAHGNQDRLAWNLLNIPHHCSYTALSDDKGVRETTPKDSVIELLERGEIAAYQVSSSNPIPDIDASYQNIQPPHIQAKNAYKRYLDKVVGRRLVVTMEEPNNNKPKPLEFQISPSGLTWERSSAIGATGIITSKPHKAG